jgi:hypothetical protein
VNLSINVKVIKVPTEFLKSLTGKDPRIEDEVIYDPIQGNVADCYFMAPLGSCAWNTTLTVPQIPIRPADNTAASFTIPFWSYNRALPLSAATVFTPAPITVSNALPQPLYAQLTPSNEIWAAIYEKAFAVFAGCTITNGNPVISQLGTKGAPSSDALSVLVNLTKKKFSFTAAPLPQTAFSTVNAPPNPYLGQQCQDYYDIIKTVCTPNAASPSSGKTKYPMVAWTYDSENYLPQAWKDKGLKYRYPTTNLDRMLVAKHTYSILGYYTSGGNKYIVLRDPLGKWGTKSPQEDPVIKSYLPPAPSNWDPVQDHAKFPVRDIAPCPSGVFGLKADAFKGCFSGFGWVQ